MALHFVQYPMVTIAVYFVDDQAYGDRKLRAQDCPPVEIVHAEPGNDVHNEGAGPGEFKASSEPKDVAE